MDAKHRGVRGRAAPRRRGGLPWLLLLGGLLVSLAVLLIALRGAGEPEHHVGGAGAAGVDFPHIHGLGYSADGSQLVVAAHDGLRVFDETTWSRPPLPSHDYMGYAATDDGFYSSGHPAPGATGLANPLGLVKSSDGGKSLLKLGFEGESDFHTLGVGYYSHAIYLLNQAPNSRLTAGMHYRLDDGKTWQQSALRGVTAAPYQIAVHPTEPATVALATEAGLLLSRDSGTRFVPAGASGPATAASFSPAGQALYVGGRSLALLALSGPDAQLTELVSPKLGPDELITAIAVNPAREQELAFATTQRNIYRSTDGGQSWTQLVRQGQA